ncbi:MAG: cell division protein ZipA [Candidatus Thiodiazotropha sp. (ex Lucinoma aequizonata)]|nr:cell division protein ZipA [Candidatus Thiodiazotropha sp. (ex Lucinoma aequizonata)]MCU7887883.1 cell division protein ZipA [Candidatus Thiodiazotropha sp. (ex Lucinoma aequizonata)]MCU7908398.1 cell division protein ZipA [Candidatus Thiodiazotropha sp. (ex Lucinoma aequizonata)]
MTLRIVLLVAGFVFLAGIYLYETKRRKRESAQARRRIQPKVNSSVDTAGEVESEPGAEPNHEPMIDSPDSDDTWVNWDEEDTELLEREFKEIGTLQADDEALSENEMGETNVAASKSERQNLFSLSAREESPVDVPKLIIQINLRSKSKAFPGPSIEKVMKDTGLQMGEMPIYQRTAIDGSNLPLFRVASMVEPGIFPKKDIEAFFTPGLTLFTQLPGPGEGMATFSDMLFTAERLAAMLDGELLDDTHSALTKQTIEHLRDQIVEHRRQVQLARSKGLT